MKLPHIIAGRFEIISFLAQGGMGVVYLGRDLLTDKPVAIKCLKPAVLAADPALIERFIREGEALRTLNHPNIVKFIAAVQEDDQHYLVMEYVGGGTLAGLLHSEPQLPVARVLAIALEITDALARAHHQNIAHRDLKPSNVLLTEDGTPLLTDFGLAEVIGSRLTKTGLVVGTRAYLAPECFKEEPLDSRVDLWAFGVMLFEMLAGSRPFQGDSMGALMGSILMDVVPDLHAIRSDVPPGLVRLIKQLLEKDREQRLPSARLVGVELERLQKEDWSDTTAAAAIPISTSIIEPSSPRSHNLPAQVTEFVGRERELEEVQRLLELSRLVTIIGPGGMGKSRLALEAAAHLLGRFSDGVYFVSLAPFTASEQIVPAIAQALGVTLFSNAKPEQILHNYLRSREVLLVLDNLEHLLAGIQVISELLQAAPQLRVLGTSRVKLELHEETIFRLEGMPFLDWKTPQEAMQYSAAKLFLQGARRIQHDFTFNVRDLPDLALICRHLEGMPLGILMAAAWLHALSLSEIAAEITLSLDFLETRERNVPDRQRSIHAVFDYSWALLTAQEQAAFQKLSVFRAGFSREAAQQVSGASVRTLADLVNKSMLRRDPNSGRYDIHELLRQFAEQQLESAGETANARAAHSIYYLEFLAQRDADLKGRRQLPALREIRIDFENIRLAWEWAVEQRQFEYLSRAVECLVNYAEMDYKFSAVFGLLEQATTFLPPDEGTPEPTWDKIVVRREWVRFRLRNSSDRLLIEAVRERAVARNDLPEMAWCHWVLADDAQISADRTGDTSFCEIHTALRRQLGDGFYLAHALVGLSIAYFSVGFLERGLTCARESVTLRGQLGDKYGQCLSTWIVGNGLLYHGKLAEAEPYFDQTIALLGEIGQQPLYRATIAAKAALAFWRGEFEVATQLAQTGLDVAYDQDYLGSKGINLILLSFMASIDGQPLHGRKLCDEAQASSRGDLAVWLSWGRALACCGLSDDQQVWHYLGHTAHQAVHNYSSQTFQIACLPLMSILAAREGNAQRAVELLGLTSTAPIDLLGWLERWVLLKDVQLHLKANLGEEGFEVAWERGKKVSLAAVMSEILERTTIDDSAR